MTKILIDETTVKLALEALKRMKSYGNTFGYHRTEQNPYEQVCEAITALETIAEQPAQQEPVAWRWVNSKNWLTYGEMPHDKFESMPLYASPPAQPAPEYCDPSSSIYGLAEMVMSDCGHSSNNQRLLDKIAARIQSHIDAAAPQPAQRTWVGLNEDQRQQVRDICDVAIPAHVFHVIETKLKENT